VCNNRFSYKIYMKLFLASYKESMEPREFTRIKNRLGLVDDDDTVSFCGVKSAIYFPDTSYQPPRQGPKKGGLVYVIGVDLNFMSSSGKEFSLTKNIRVSKRLSTIGEGSFLQAQEVNGALCFGHNNALEGKIIGDPIIFGNFSMEKCSEANGLIAVGHNTLKRSSIIGDSIALGAYSMGDCGETECNLGVGRDTLFRVRDSYNIAFGIEAGKECDNSVFNHNIMFGKESMKSAHDTCINIIAMGSQSASNISGNTFQSIFIGDKVASNLKSDVITVNSIVMGTQAAMDASNLSECIIQGANAGRRISGNKAVIIGSSAAESSEGCMESDIIFGHQSGNFRKYLQIESKNIFIGVNSGSGTRECIGEGVQNIGLGTDSLSGNKSGVFNMGFGNRAGADSEGHHILAFGDQAGVGSRGNYNIFGGMKSGQKCNGSYNILFGNGDDDSLLESEYDYFIGMGTGLIKKGSRAVVLGNSAGSKSIGYLVRDILIGDSAGSGQRYSDSVNDSKEMICIGSSAGQGDPDSPTNSEQCIMFGHGAGKSDTQVFSQSLFFGNNAGSFASRVSESVVMGHNAGIGMCGDKNVFIGSHTGFNFKGSGNVLMGPRVGDNLPLDEVNDKLMIGNENISILFGDIKKSNIALGLKRKYLPDIDGESCVFMESSLKPPSSAPPGGSLLYVKDKDLCYMNGNNVNNLTVPVRVVFYREFNESLFTLTAKPGIETGYRIRVIGVPIEGDFFEGIFQIKQTQGKIVCLKGTSTVKYSEGDSLKVSSLIPFKGAVYLEIYGADKSVGFSVV